MTKKRMSAKEAVEKHHIANRAYRKAKAAPAKKRRIPKVAPKPDYGKRQVSETDQMKFSAQESRRKAKKKSSAVKRAIKFLKGDYTK